MQPKYGLNASIMGHPILHSLSPCQQRPHLFHLCGAQFGSRIPSLRTNICGRVTHDNVRQLKSTNDAVLIVVPFHEKVHEFLTLLNGCQVLCTTFYETYVDRVECLYFSISAKTSMMLLLASRVLLTRAN